MGKRYHVVPDGMGSWKVVGEGAKRAISTHRTQADAEAAAKGYASRAGGGEVRIHGKDGRIRDSDTVGPGHDPFPPRDQKH